VAFSEVNIGTCSPISYQSGNWTIGGYVNFMGSFGFDILPLPPGLPCVPDTIVGLEDHCLAPSDFEPIISFSGPVTLSLSADELSGPISITIPQPWFAGMPTQFAGRFCFRVHRPVYRFA
jgi:hypothetical protein